LNRGPAVYETAALPLSYVGAAPRIADARRDQLFGKLHVHKPRGDNRQVRDAEGGPIALSPGWNRRNPWTLRFVDSALEREYESAMSAPGRQRLRIANLVGACIWVSIGVVGPPLLGLPPLSFYMAAAINAGWETFMVLVTLRPITLAQVWALAVITTTLSALSIILAFGTGETFLTVGAAALMTNAAFGIALVRPAGWVAATLSVMTVLVYSIVVALFDFGGVGAFVALLLVSLLSGTTIGARYLEEAERSAFAQGFLVADLHRKIDRLFRQYLSPDVAQALVDDPSRANLGGEVADVSVLFADLEGFTPFSERTPAHEVVAMLNAAFGAAVPAVFAEGGTVVQFMGDALMAVFNAPIRQEDHALRACRAGLALQQLMAEIEGGTADSPRFRVGINSGPALVGNIGSAELHNFLAIGDTTNVAARLQAFAPAGSVVISQPTYDLVHDSVEVRSLGMPDLKGKAKPIEVYELIGLRP
jgi:class 3 adenylate cyclase